MSSSLFATPGELAIPVSELNRRARALLENGFPPLWVSGEISNLTRHASGHWYFSLKDEKAQVRCVMFRHRNQQLDFEIREGLQVEARAIVTLYEPRGDFQLNVESLRPAGLGALFDAFARLKARLEAEGLFSSARKRPLPAHPAAIGIITSPQAAALRDVLTTLRRRMPSIPVVIYPTPVQGKGAAQFIARALDLANARGEVDVLILCRGGGSIEDLWEFNEEAVARALARSRIPVVCGVGHETDFTIADFAADVRAPTPTAAAELASPNRRDLAARLSAVVSRLARDMRRALEMRMQHVDHLSRRLVHPGQRLAHQRTTLVQLATRLTQAMDRGLEGRRFTLTHLASRLKAARPDPAGLERHRRQLALRLATAMRHTLAAARQRCTALSNELSHLNPQAVLERGYSITRDEGGRVVRDATTLSLGSTVSITFAVGEAKARVTAKSS
jgi:exodeoxyribonuclease VII large subunit